jgi:N-formylmaleamate deformylase
MPLAPYLELLEAARRGSIYEQIRHKYAWDDEHVRLRAEWMATCDPRAVEAAHRGFHEDDVHRDLPHVGVPTFLMVAGKGGVILPADVEEIRDLVPTITVACIETAGHMIPFDDFDAFFAALGTMLGADM